MLASSSTLSPGPTLRQDALHIAALCAFAFAQPLYDVLGRNATFFVAHHTQPVDLILFVLGYSLVIPAALIAAVALSARIGRAARGVTAFAVEAALIAACALPIVVRIGDPPGAIAAPIAATVGGILTVALRRTALLRRFMTVLSLSVIVFPAWFLFGTPAFQILRAGHLERSVDVEIDSDIPVVLILFDALSLPALLREDMRIDAEAFPNFARVENDFTWFRNATTVAVSTDFAVPALLTGRYAEEGAISSHTNHPDNLFTWFGPSRSIAAQERITRMCPPSLCQIEPAPLLTRLDELFTDSTVVLLHLLLPDDWRLGLPPILSQWQGFTIPATEQTREAIWTNILRGRVAGHKKFRSERNRMLARAETSRLESALAFSRALDDLPDRSFFYLHVYLPHDPYTLSASGRKYVRESEPRQYAVPFADSNRSRIGRRLGELTTADRGAVWAQDVYLRSLAAKRHLLQVGAADGALGEMLDRMQASGLYERALVIVTSDHGESYAPDERLRNPSDGNTIHVPLFIKLPGQMDGRVDLRNAELVDVAPTIAAALGERLPWDTDGRSLLREPETDRPEKRVFSAHDGNVSLAWPADSLGAALLDLNALVGVRRSPDAMLRHTAQSELIDLPLANFVRRGHAFTGYGVKLSPVEARIQQAPDLAAVDASSGFVPSYLTGEVVAGPRKRKRLQLAIAVNGVIRSTARSHPGPGGAIGFAALIPESALRPGANEVAIFRVTDAR